MLMFVLLFDLIIFLASASKFLGLSLAHALSRLSVGKNTNGICVFYFFFLFFFSTSRMVLFGSLYELSFFI